MEKPYFGNIKCTVDRVLLAVKYYLRTNTYKALTFISLFLFWHKGNK